MSDITKILGIPEETWIWCMHCERCFIAGEYRLIKKLQMCPYPDCDGDTVMDAWNWEEIRAVHTDYPEVPEREKIYHQY